MLLDYEVGDHMACVYPSALSGIAAAVMLGVWQTIGETMTVLMVAGVPCLPVSPVDPLMTMTAAIASGIGMLYAADYQYQAIV